jgi:archaetidylinositol phosphate synthase
MLTKLKDRIQRMLTSEAVAASKLGLTPNIISGVGIVLAFLAAIAYWAWRFSQAYLILAAVLLFLSGFCDALDGIVARINRKVTVFGGLLDSLLDRYADAAVYVGIIVAGLCDSLSGLVALTGSLLVSYSRARAEAAGAKMESVGIAERAERMIILVVASIAAFVWQPETVMEAAVILIAVLSNLTVVQRVLRVYEKLKKKSGQI